MGLTAVMESSDVLLIFLFSVIGLSFVHDIIENRNVKNNVGIIFGAEILLYMRKSDDRANVASIIVHNLLQKPIFSVVIFALSKKKEYHI